jgi:hypothetical protein
MKLPAIRRFPIELEISRKSSPKAAQSLKQGFTPGLADYTEAACIGDMDLDFVAFTQFQRLNHRSGKPDSEAISPFRNLHCRIS